jgi:hypothetical protein
VRLPLAHDDADAGGLEPFRRYLRVLAELHHPDVPENPGEFGRDLPE